MGSCSNSTYMSAKYLKAYEEKRKKHLDKMAYKKKKEEESGVIKPKSQMAKEDGMSIVKEEEREFASSDEEERELYDQRNRSAEEVDSDELDGELNLSGDEGMDKAWDVRKEKQAQKAKFKRGAKRAYRQEIDTNIF